MSTHFYQRWSFSLLLRISYCFCQSFQIISITNLLYMPAICFKTFCYVFIKRKSGITFNRNMVVVIKIYHISELQMTCKGSSFCSYAFHYITITADCINSIVKQIKSRFIVTCGKMLLCYRKSYSVGKSLSQRTSGYIYPVYQSKLRMPCSFTMQLPEI